MVYSSRNTIAPPLGDRPHRWSSSRALPAQKKREHELRARAGVAYLRLAGTAEDQSAAIDRHHSQISRRRQGQSGLAGMLLEVDGLERDGIDTKPMFEAWLETVLEARARRVGSLARAALDLSREEQVADGEEDVAQLDFHDDPRGGARGYYVKLLRYIGVALPLAMALKREAAEGRP